MGCGKTFTKTSPRVRHECVQSTKAFGLLMQRSTLTKSPPNAWDDLKFEFSLIFQRLLTTLLAVVLAAIIYPIAIYVFFKLLF